MMIAAHFRHLFEHIFSPFFISLFLLVFSIVWLWAQGDGKMVRGCLLISFFGFMLFSTGWLPGTLTHVLETRYEIVVKANPGIQWIVVLGGGHAVEYAGAPANDELSTTSLERLVEGVRLYRQLPNAKLLLSGGTGSLGPISEAKYLATVASWFHIPKDDIVLEEESINTADEAVAIKKMINEAPFYLVTSAIHMPRSMALCRQQGLHPIAAPTDHTFYWESSRWTQIVVPNASNLGHTSNVWHEVLGLVWGKIRGII